MKPLHKYWTPGTSTPSERSNMPLQRSPPRTSPAPAPAPELGSTLSMVCAPGICESDTASERSDSRNISVRHKRRHGDDDIKELKGLISSLSSKVDQSFLELKQKNEELKESLQFMSDKYDLILKTLQNLQEDRTEDKKTIQKLEEKIEVLERKNRSASLEIRNVPICLRDDRKFESKEDASLIVKTLSKAVEVDIQDCDIKDIYRIQTHKEGSKPIIVELNSVLKKDKIMQGVKNYNKKRPNEEKLNTGHLNIPGPVKRVFISDALTPNAQKLFYAARQFAKENDYTYCWTSRGSIFLRKIEEAIPTWTLPETFTGLAIVLALYLVLVVKILPAYMKNREPFKLNNLLLAYNAFQVAFSVYLVLIYLRYIYRFNVITTRCPQGEDLQGVINEIYPYFIAKHLDLLDTVFFVLRKKDNQVTFLHLYHHTTMVTWTWLHLMYHPTDNFVVVGMLNSFVHVLMYAYYGISSLGPDYAKYIWWKKHLTKFQLIQFILVVSHLHFQQKLSPCPIPGFFQNFCMFVITSFFGLFLKFYVDSYRSKSKKMKEIEKIRNTEYAVNERLMKAR